MDLSTLSITELKAFAYDLIAKAQATQRELEIVNKLISDKTKEVQNANS